MRMGNGRVDNTDFNFYFNKTETEIFSPIMNLITDEMLNYVGKYTLKSSGIPCNLTVYLYSDNEVNKFEFSYGSQFQGLPEEIYNLITNALTLTDPWYEIQKRKIKKTDKNS